MRVRMSDVRQALSPVPETLERSLSNLAARHRKLAGLEGLGLAVAREVADRFGLALNLDRPSTGGLEVTFSVR